MAGGDHPGAGVAEARPDPLGVLALGRGPVQRHPGERGQGGAVGSGGHGGSPSETNDRARWPLAGPATRRMLRRRRHAAVARGRQGNKERGDCREARDSGRDRGSGRALRRGDGNDRGRRHSARRARRAELLRPRPQGLRRHRPQHDLPGLVHGGRRRPVGHLLAQRGRHQRPHAPVRRDRRQHVHRSADAGHDLPRGARSDGHVLHDRRLQQRPPLLHHHHLHRRPGTRRRAHAHALPRPVGRPGLRDAGPAGRRDRRRGQPERRRQQRLTGGLGPGGRQHQHRHQRVQPRLRGQDVRGAPVKPRLRRRERRLRGQRQRRRADARLRASADAV